MAVTITALAVDKDYEDGTILTEAQLDAALGVGAYTSIEDYCNTELRLNLTQATIDAWGSANYTFNGDGLASLTNTLYDKQSVTDYYNGGDISIGVAGDGSWIAVDAVNAAVTITPELAGKYRAVFYFTHRATSTATTEFSVDVGFRITDGTSASYAVNSGGYMPATAAASGVFINPVFLTYEFDWATTTAKTITLQKYVRTATNVSANVVNAAAATGEIYMVIEKV